MADGQGRAWPTAAGPGFRADQHRGDRDQLAIAAPARGGGRRAGKDEAAAALSHPPARAARPGAASGGLVNDAADRAHLRSAFRAA